MKHEICNDYKKPILLSEFNLIEQNFSNEWLNGFFGNPVIDNLILLDKNSQMVNKKLYINFSYIELQNNNLLFKELHKKIKEHIFNDWSFTNSVYPIYNYYRVKSDNKNNKKYVFVYLSSNPSNSVFDFSLIENKEYFIQNILEMLVKASLLETINQSKPLSFDICLGKVFLNPIITNNEKINKDFINVFSFRLKYKDYKLGFTLKNEFFQLEKDKSKFDLYDDVCLLNNFKYEKKQDARTYGRLFLDFKNFDKLKATKFITQLHLYKLIESMLKKWNIKYEKTVFNPEYLYNRFSLSNNKVNEIYIYINESEKDEYEKMLFEKGIKNGLNSFKNYLSSLGIKSNLFINPTLDDLINNQNKYNLFLMYGNQYDDNYIKLKTEEKEESWNDSMQAFLDKKFFNLNKDSFLISIKNFDIYSQVKMFNIYANINNLNPIVSQGLILKNSILFEKPIKDWIEDSYENGLEEYIESGIKKTLKEKPYPRNGTKSTISKIINELNIKYELYVTKKFEFLTEFTACKKIIDFNNIKVFKKISKEKETVYSMLEFTRNKKENTFDVVKNRIILNKDIDNLEIDIKNELKYTDSVIIINDYMIIKVKDNDDMPFMIIEESNFNNKEKDPILLIEKHIDEGRSNTTSVSKKTGVNDNLFFPYNTPVVKKLIDTKSKEIKGYVNCLLDFSNNDLKIYMNLSNAGIQATMPKNNRLESIELHKNKDFSYEKINWLDNEQILYFYLSTLTFNYLNINELSKKSLLNKLSEVILIN